LSEKTVTEVIVQLQSSVATLDGRIANIEYLLKCLLKKANESEAPVSQAVKQPVEKLLEYPTAINKENFDTRPKTSVFAEMASKAGVEVEGQVSRPKNEKKSSVSQTIKREDAPLFLATVEIFDDNDLLVNQTRTNTKGRWLASLAPGNYKVHVVKNFPADSSKKPIDKFYMIEVFSTEKPVDLGTLNLA
jgi:predicted phage tail protein